MRCSFSAASASCFSAWTVKRVSEHLCELHDVSNYYFLLFFCLPQLALLSAGSFSPTPWASSVLSLQPSRSVSRSVSHWMSFFLTWAFAAAPGSQDEICCFQTELSWTRFWLWDLLHVFLLFPWRHSATPTAFSWSFSLSFLSLGSSLSRFSPPVLSLWALLLIHLFEFLAKFLSFSYGGSSSPWAFCISSFTSSILRHVPLVLSSQLRRLLDIQLNGLGVSGKAPDPLLINVPEAGVSLGLLS